MRYFLLGLLFLNLATLGCSKGEVKAESEVKLSIEPSGYFWLNLMPPIPREGPNFHAIIKARVSNVGKGIARNVKAVSADMYKVSDAEETKIGTVELGPSPNTATENDLLPGEEMNLEFGGSMPGATQVTPGMKLYGKVFFVWEGGHTVVRTPTDEVMATQ